VRSKPEESTNQLCRQRCGRARARPTEQRRSAVLAAFAIALTALFLFALRLPAALISALISALTRSALISLIAALSALVFAALSGLILAALAWLILTSRLLILLTHRSPPGRIGRDGREQKKCLVGHADRSVARTCAVAPWLLNAMKPFVDC